MPSRVDQQMRDAIVAMFRQGHSYIEIMNRLKTTRYTIRRSLRKAGVLLPDPRQSAGKQSALTRIINNRANKPVKKWPSIFNALMIRVMEDLCDNGPATKEMIRRRLSLPDQYVFSVCIPGYSTSSCFRILEKHGMIHRVHLGKKIVHYFPTTEAMKIRHSS